MHGSRSSAAVAAADSKVDSALSLAAVAALGDRGEGVGAEYPDDPEHAGTLHWIGSFIFCSREETERK